MTISMYNTKDKTREEFNKVLAVLTTPGTSTISFCVQNDDGTVSEVKRFDLTTHEMLISSV